jgi:hypothetical protein
MGVMNGGPINLASARMRRAHLRFATLSGANLAGANLAGADLTDARLDGANLANADLSNATLSRTDLAGARLAGARLDGANLLEVRNLTQGQFDDAMGDAHRTAATSHEAGVLAGSGARSGAGGGRWSREFSQGNIEGRAAQCRGWSVAPPRTGNAKVK